jgi:succinate dehydrogenase / fumarate reductase iron-sulfur subunit
MDRAIKMVEEMDKQGFGYCTNAKECVDACPKEIPFEAIVGMNRDYLKATLVRVERAAGSGGPG